MKKALRNWNRRDLLNLGVSTAAAAAIESRGSLAQERASHPWHIIDTNVSLFQWPFRRLPLDDTAALVAKLRVLGISQAWSGSYEGLLHRDIAAVNRRLAEACQPQPELIPIGSINLELPSWQDDLRRCVEQHGMPGVRLHPNYHGYQLDDPRFAQFLELATAAHLFVQLATAMEDTRTQHALVRVADVGLTPLPNVMSHLAGVRVQLLNYRPQAAMFDSLAKTTGLFFDTARVEATDGVPQLIKLAQPGRVLFGSHTPFLIPEAALIRVNESGLLDDAALRCVLSENAKQLMGTANA